jgi:hypothetical protein
MQNSTHMIEFIWSKDGIQAAKEYRKNNPDFKYRPIKVVIQAFPDRIQCGKIYELT